MPRILVVEDDEAMADVVRVALTDDGYETMVVGTGVDALMAARSTPFDAAAVDVMLPGMTGFELCRQLRAFGQEFPILLLTARDAVNDRVHGLDSGGDDYLVKPFALAELSARMRALLRRSAAQPRTRLALGNLTMDLTSGRVDAGGTQIMLTGRESALLRALVGRAPEVLGRRHLLDDVWGTVHIDAGIVDQYVRYLRKKLTSADSTAVIETVRGQGYRAVEKSR